MPETSRKILIVLVIVLGTGALIGWSYDRPATGLLVASLAALFWHVHRLIAFDRAMQSRNFGAFQYGEGVWQRIYSRLAFERERGRRHKQQYRRLLKEIRKSTDAMPDGAVILSAGNEIVACNRAAGTLAGLKRKKDRGQRVDNIIRDPAFSELLQPADGAGSADIASPVADGRWLNCRVVPYGADQKLLLLRDVTERMILNRVRRDFVANASHELRSPLTVISGYLEGLADDESVPDSIVRPLREMRGQAQRMTKIIDELIELSRLEADGRAADDESIDVTGLLNECLSDYAGQSGVPGIRVDSQSTARLLGKASEIESVIRNLLSNAVRHTEPDGQITMVWRSDAQGADLIVKDTGEGIEAELIPRLTERFFRVDRGRAREDGGFGLGLAIVKHILGRHEAVLNIESTPGEGSEFRCHFPVSRVDVSAPVSLASGGESG